jgi:cysteinyl-tRNA synthetase
MDDDLNISAAMAVLFGSVKKINILKRDKQIDAEGASKVLDVFRSINTVLELLEFDDDVENSSIQKLIKARDQARSEQNWELADRIRNQLRASGIIVQDDKL